MCLAANLYCSVIRPLNDAHRADNFDLNYGALHMGYDFAICQLNDTAFHSNVLAFEPTVHYQKVLSCLFC